MFIFIFQKKVLDFKFNDSKSLFGIFLGDCNDTLFIFIPSKFFNVPFPVWVAQFLLRNFLLTNEWVNKWGTIYWYINFLTYLWLQIKITFRNNSWKVWNLDQWNKLLHVVTRGRSLCFTLWFTKEILKTKMWSYTHSTRF